MNIAGFQSLSLLDYPGTASSIIFTQGCPFRCVYCHNPDLLPVQGAESSHWLQEEAILERVVQHKNVVKGVCITGGEPTVQADLPRFIRRLREAGLLVKLDTNGIHPRMIRQLLDEQLLNFLAMDLKHTWDRYQQVIGLQQPAVVARCQETFSIIQQSGIPHEFRTTVYPKIHSSEDLQMIAQQLRPGESYALQAIRYQKTLDPSLDRAQNLDLHAVKAAILERQPELCVEIRD